MQTHRLTNGPGRGPQRFTAGLLLGVAIGGASTLLWTTSAPSQRAHEPVSAIAIPAPVPAAAFSSPRPQTGFAFGTVEFDWDPTAPGGVPGFDAWPPGKPSSP
jgi:hypothetical protein